MKEGMRPVRTFYGAVAKAIAGAVDMVAPATPAMSPFTRDPHWPGLARKKMDIDRINTTYFPPKMRNGNKERERRLMQRQKGII